MKVEQEVKYLILYYHVALEAILKRLRKIIKKFLKKTFKGGVWEQD